MLPVLFTFYVQGVLKLKKNNSGPKSLNLESDQCRRRTPVVPVSKSSLHRARLLGQRIEPLPTHNKRPTHVSVSVPQTQLRPIITLSSRRHYCPWNGRSSRLVNAGEVDQIRPHYPLYSLQFIMYEHGSNGRCTKRVI